MYFQSNDLSNYLLFKYFCKRRIIFSLNIFCSIYIDIYIHNARNNVKGSERKHVAYKVPLPKVESRDTPIISNDIKKRKDNYKKTDDKDCKAQKEFII